MRRVAVPEWLSSALLRADGVESEKGGVALVPPSEGAATLSCGMGPGGCSCDTWDSTPEGPGHEAGGAEGVGRAAWQGHGAAAVEGGAPAQTESTAHGNVKSRSRPGSLDECNLQLRSYSPPLTVNVLLGAM